MKLSGSGSHHRLHSAPEIGAAPARRRPVWHQRLVDAEAGYRLGMRTSSVLYLHMFAASILIVSGGVLGLNFLDWLILWLCIAAVTTAELFNAALHALAAAVVITAPEAARQANRLATAATLTTILAALAAALAVLGYRFINLLT